MNLENKKWVNPNLNKTLLSKKKISKMVAKNKISAIYDLRILDNPAKKTISIYKIIDSILVENYINLHSTKEKVILISEYERTYVPVLSSFRKLGYKNIFIYKADKDNLDWLIKK